MTIIAEILSLMHRAGWSRNRLAHEAGVAQSGVSKLLAGKGGMRLESLEKLKAALESALEKKAQIARGSDAPPVP